MFRARTQGFWHIIQCSFQYRVSLGRVLSLLADPCYLICILTFPVPFSGSVCLLRDAGRGRRGFSSVQSLRRLRLFATPWTAARQASLSITNSRSLPKLMSVESVMPSNHLILCRSFLLLPSIFPSIRVFSN